ncbi:MAG: tRNA (adenosine(37)-N6)-threonylcarbamoyltransferase complex ATPase subunit type 1 TsaE [Acutalibacteraceae bacterium]|jgi:tRNA threonylcarbamoyladenosine biosynthesis protein TsaE
MKKFISHGREETERIAEEFSRSLCGGEIIAFIGGLGAGKTCFTKGLARGLGYTGEVTSPTFALINEYVGGRLPLFHFDMYRISSWQDLYSSGFFDYMDAGGVIAAEWSENIENALPEGTIYVKIEDLGEDTRSITIFTKEEAVE